MTSDPLFNPPEDSPFPLSDEDIAAIKADFMAQDPKVIFVVDDEHRHAE